MSAPFSAAYNIPLFAWHSASAEPSHAVRTGIKEAFQLAPAMPRALSVAAAATPATAVP